MNDYKKLLLLIGYLCIAVYISLMVVFLVMIVRFPQKDLILYQSPGSRIEDVVPLQPIVSTSTPAVISKTLLTATVNTDNPELLEDLEEIRETLPADHGLNVEILEEMMLDLINNARRDAGLNLVAWDSFVASVAERHAKDMAEHHFFSHWNMIGLGPDHRYVQAGGSEVAMENISTYWYGYEDGSPAEIEDFEEVVRNAHVGLMNSPGHRRNILDPDHTHVGVGFAFNRDTGDFKLAQIFFNRYVRLDPLPTVASSGEGIKITGQLLLGATNPILNVAFELFPKPMSVAVLNQTNAYESAAEFQNAYQPDSVVGDSFTFNANVGSTPGLYHFRIWVNYKNSEIHAVNWIIEVK